MWGFFYILFLFADILHKPLYNNGVTARMNQKPYVSVKHTNQFIIFDMKQKTKKNENIFGVLIKKRYFYSILRIK